jgi:hypothetical protein
MRALLLMALVLATGVQPSFADVRIPAGGVVSLGGGSLVNAGDVVIGGTLDAGAGSITLSGDWTRTGTFVPGTSTVSFTDGGRAQAAFTGDSGFHILRLVSTTGKTYVIESGRTLNVGDALTIRGTSGAPIQVASPDPARVAFVHLAAAGIQDIEFVGVSNVHASGQPLAPDQTNQGGTGNDRGWFGSGRLEALPIPTLSTLALLLLALLMVVTATRRALR